MQRILFILCAACLLAVTSCKKATYLKADVDQILVGASGDKGSVALHSDGTSFKLESAPDWVSVHIKDSTLTYSIGENTTGAVKEDKIAVSNGDQLLVLILRQGAPATVLAPEKSSLSFSYEGGTQTVNVQTDAIGVKVEVTDGFSAKYSDGVLSVTANPTDGESRVEGTATLTADALSATVNLTVGTKICATCGGKGKVRCTKCGGCGYIVINGTEIGCTRCGGYSAGICSSAAERAAARGISVQGSGRMRCPTCGGKGHS